MTTLIIEIPDTKSDVLSAITKITKNAGLKVTIEDDEGLSEKEFELLKEGYREAILITQGKLKGIPASELWND